MQVNQTTCKMAVYSGHRMSTGIEPMSNNNDEFPA